MTPTDTYGEIMAQEGLLMRDFAAVCWFISSNFTVIAPNIMTPFTQRLALEVTKLV